MAVTALVSSVALLAATGASAARHPLPLKTGFLEPKAFGWGGLQPFQNASRAGATLARIWVHWNDTVVNTSRVPPAGDLTDPNNVAYNWSSLDQQVENATTAGLAPILDIRDAPLWAQGGGLAVTDRRMVRGVWKPSAALLADFATAVAKRYQQNSPYLDAHGDQVPWVRFWQVWNEANGDIFLSPPSPTRYLEMLNAAASRIRAVDPRNFVITSAVSPFHHRNVVAPLIFMAKMLCMSYTKPYHRLAGCTLKPAKFDIWAQNPYTPGGPTHHAYYAYDVSLGDMGDVRQLLNAAVRYRRITTRCFTAFCPVIGNHVGLWVTEFSWDARPPDPEGVPSAVEAAWVSQALFQMRRLGVTAFIWHRLRDDKLSGAGSTPYQSGLFRCQLVNSCTNITLDRPKLAMYAFRFPVFAYRRLGRIFVWGRTPWGQRGHVVIQKRTARGWRTVGGAWTSRRGIFRWGQRSALRTGVFRAIYVLRNSPIHPNKKYVSLGASLVPPRDRPYSVFGCGGQGSLRC